jgi:S1-C subfamily serine protease
MLHRRTLFLAPILVAFGCAAASITPDASYKTITRDVTRNIVRSAVRVRTPMGAGSGIVLYSGISPITTRQCTYILTASHVVHIFRNVVVDVFERTPLSCTGSDAYHAKVVNTDPANDLALLEVENLNLGFIPKMVNYTDLAKIEVAEPIYAVGCQIGRIPVLTEGRLADYDDDSCCVTAESIVGSSGGGIFLANSLYLGMIRGIGIAPVEGDQILVPHIVLVIPATKIARWLEASDYKFIVKR